MDSILISGAGIAGPTLAYWLLRHGFTPTLIERAPRFREGGYMIDFWGAGFDVAERMDLLPRLREVGYGFNRIKFVDEKDHLRSEFGGDILRRSLSERFISLQRGDLAKAIFDAIADNVEVIFGESITAIHENGSGAEVFFERLPPRRFDLVVGCDGLHSTVRQITFGSEQQFEKYLGYYAASFVTNHYLRREELAYVSYAAPGRQISRYALRGDRSAFLLVFARERPFGDHLHADEAKRVLREVFAEDSWIEIQDILARMDDCEELYFDSVSQIRMSAWSRGRTVLVGDAAYCPSLLAGEGAVFAMTGAYILAGELQRANGDYARAFTVYEQRLHPFIDRKQRGAQRLAGSFAPKTLFGLWVRDIVLRCANFFPPLGKKLLRGLVSDNFDLPSYDT